MEITTLKTGIEGVLSDSVRYKNEKGEISLLHPCKATMYSFEIYCVAESLFDDIERYDTLQEAEARIEFLLTDALASQKL